ALHVVRASAAGPRTSVRDVTFAGSRAADGAYRFELARDRAAVAGDDVAVITLLAGLHDAVAADGEVRRIGAIAAAELDDAPLVPVVGRRRIVARGGDVAGGVEGEGMHLAPADGPPPQLGSGPRQLYDAEAAEPAAREDVAPR